LVDKMVAGAAVEERRRVSVAADSGLCLSFPLLLVCTDSAALSGLAAGSLPALEWPDHLGLDTIAGDVEAKAARPRRGSAHGAA